MLAVFPKITEKIERLGEIQYNDEMWEEIDQIQTFLRENDGYRRYDLQTNILKYF